MMAINAIAASLTSTESPFLSLTTSTTSTATTLALSFTLTDTITSTSTVSTTSETVLVDEDPPALALTVYSNPSGSLFDPTSYIGRDVTFSSYIAHSIEGYAVVNQRTKLAGINNTGESFYCSLEGVAELLDPTTVSFLVENDPSAAVIDQSYQFDLISSSRVLDYYVDSEIEMYLPKDQITGVSEIIKGKLLSHDYDNVVLQSQDGSIDILPTSQSSYRLPALPENMRTTPSLELNIVNDEIIDNPDTPSTTFDVKTTYKTDGIAWRADYNVTLNEAEEMATIGSWVSVLNMTGMTYDDAVLKLIAGDVNIIKSDVAETMYKLNSVIDVNYVSDYAFVEQSFFEYHMYTLPRRATLKNASLNQMALFPTTYDVKVNKELIFQPIKTTSWGTTPVTDISPVSVIDEKVSVMITITNTEDNNLGIPLPKGKVRVFKQDGDVSEFVGENAIDHTAKDEMIRLSLGKSFDISGERTVESFTYDKAAGVMNETVVLTIHNHKSIQEPVIVKDVMYRWMNYSLSGCSPTCGEDESGTVTWVLNVPANEVFEVRYTVTYSVV